MEYNKPRQSVRILIVGPGPVQVGGVASFIQFLLHSEHLNQRFEIAHMDTARDVKDLPTAGRFSWRNLTYLLRQVPQLFKLLRVWRPDIVHLSVTAGWSFWKIGVFLWISHASGAKVVAHMHGGAFNLFFEQSHPLIQRMIAWTLNRADAVVALSVWWKQFYLKKISPALKVAVIFNCPDEAFSYCTELPDRSERSGHKVLFVGSLGRRKGIFDILRAVPLVLEKINSVQFIFLGWEEYAAEMEQIRAICRDRNLDSHLHFPGRVIGAEKYCYYQQADVFILPSHAENLPFSLLEAMAMGLPVITTPVGGIPEFVENGKNGYLINPGDAADLAQRMTQLLSDQQVRKRMGDCNTRMIQERLHPELITCQWERLYLQLLGIHTDHSGINDRSGIQTCSDSTV